ncbi:transposable element Tc1 transposase [Trichonephila clavipes]|nr:transposable element Tc1 transposase [Trichonephila clavipes]
MQSLIRERFWIIRARKTIKSILNECFICARFKGKSLSSGPSPLPPDRVNDCTIFEVVGIDLAGPLFLKTGEKELIPLTPAMFLIENRCSDTTDIDELNSRDLRKRMKYRIKLLSDLRQRFRKEYLSELIQKENDNRVREPRIGEMVLIGNDNKKRLSWPIAKIIELIPGRDGEIRTVRLKTQHGTVIRPVQRIFPLEVQAIANSDKELKEESISVKSTTPEKVLNTNDAIVKKYTSSGRLVKEPKRLDLLNYNCYRFETLPKSQRGDRSVTSVAAEFGIAHIIVSRLWRQFQTTGTAIQGFSRDRPRGTTPADDQYIVLQARKNRRQTAGEIARHMTQATGRPISRFTVARRLHGGGLFARRPVRCVTLTPAHRRRRSLWCREHRNWRDNEWGRVLFTDESIFSLSSDSHRILIWRERGSRNHPSNIIERDRYGGRGVLVWGGIMLGSRTDLHIFDAGSVNGTRYCNEILLPYVRLFRGAMGLQFLFMDDNAPCHRTVAAEQLLE